MMRRNVYFRVSRKYCEGPGLRSGITWSRGQNKPAFGQNDGWRANHTATTTNTSQNMAVDVLMNQKVSKVHEMRSQAGFSSVTPNKPSKRLEIRPLRQEFLAAEYPTASKASIPDDKIAIQEIVSTKIAQLNQILASKEYELVDTVFTSRPHWRDHLTINRTNLTTLSGLTKIKSYLRSQNAVDISDIKIEDGHEVQVSSVDPAGTIKCLQSIISFNTTTGSGRGVIRLLRDVENQEEWRIFSLFTTLWELKTEKKERQHSVPPGWGKGVNYQEYRDEKREFTKEEPAVLIVGQSLVACEQQRSG